MISERTRHALAAAKARGVQLGKNGKTLAERNRTKAAAFTEDIRDIIDLIRSEGHTTVRAICEELNLRQIPTPSGAGYQWHLPTVHRLLGRLS